MRARRRLAVFPVAILAGGLLTLGCGGDSGSTTVTETTGAGGGGGASKPLAIDMGDFFYRPKNATTSAGSVTMTAKNIGKVVHELVLARTNAAPGDLPTLPDGSVDEAKLEQQDRAPGEIGETAPGQTGKLTVDLPAGNYVMYCNIPGHYAAGMYGSLTIK